MNKFGFLRVLLIALTSLFLLTLVACAPSSGTVSSGTSTDTSSSSTEQSSTDIEQSSNSSVNADHKHFYKVTEKVNSTCTEQGYSVYTCSCGDSYFDDYVVELGHSFANGKCVTCGEEEPALEEFFTFTLTHNDTYTIKLKSSTT